VKNETAALARAKRAPVIGGDIVGRNPCGALQKKPKNSKKMKAHNAAGTACGSPLLMSRSNPVKAASCAPCFRFKDICHAAALFAA
jgi:hypothetical protein